MSFEPYYQGRCPTEVLPVALPNGKNFPVTVRLIEPPTDKVLFDPDNPRIMEEIRAWKRANDSKRVTQDVLRELNLKADGTDELIEAIQGSGRTWDRIWVDKNGVAREGNGRLVAYKANLEMFPEEKAWRTVPAYLFPANFTDDNWRTVIALRHQFQREWSSVVKAQSYRAAVRSKGSEWTYESYAKHLSMTPKQVKVYVMTADLMDRYHKHTGEPPARDDFTKFWKLCGKSSLLKAMDFDPKTEKAGPLFVKEFAKFADLVKDGKINDCRHVDEILPKIWTDQGGEVWKTMQSRGTTAAKATWEAQESKTALSKTAENLLAKLKKLSNEQRQEIRMRKGDRRRREASSLDTLYYLLRDVIGVTGE